MGSTDDRPGTGGYVLAAVTDLFFTTRIRATAEDLGATVRTASDPESALALVRKDRPRLVVVDLEARTFDPVALVRSLRALPDAGNLPIVGFLSHVHVERKREAEAAGCDEAMPRSGFVRRLPELLGADPGS